MRPNGTPVSFPLAVMIGLFAAGLVVSNIIAVKAVSVGPLVLPAATVVFPVTYIIGDVVTEVYGYRTSRRMIWAGFLGNLLAVMAILAGAALPPAPFWSGQEAYRQILGMSPRVLLASLTAYLAGMFVNAAILSRMKVRTGGRWMLPRFWISTVAGETLDSAVFLLIAFWGTMPAPALLGMIPVHSGAKILYEIAVSPVSAALAVVLKRTEGLDAFDDGVRIHPLLLNG